MVGSNSSLKPFVIAFSEKQRDKNNLWFTYLHPFSVSLSSLNAKYSELFGWGITLLISCWCNGSVTLKSLELGVSALICGVSYSYLYLLFGCLVLKKSIWKLFSSGGLGAKRLLLAFLVVIICIERKKMKRD